MASLRIIHLITWYSAHPACSLGPWAQFPHLRGTLTIPHLGDRGVDMQRGTLKGHGRGWRAYPALLASLC